MRIAFLFEPSLGPPAALDFIFSRWTSTLLESQNEIKVITRKGIHQRFSPPPSRLEWSEPMNRWGLWELPHLLSALLPFRPEVLHLVIDRPLKAWQVWPALTALPGFTRLVVSLGDAVQWPARWPHQAQFLGPSASSTVPTFGTAPAVSTPHPDRIQVFVPGRLGEFPDWRGTLNALADLIVTRPDLSFVFGWDWTEIPVNERRNWRGKWLRSVPFAQVRFVGELPLSQQAAVMASSQLVVTAPLAELSWVRTLFESSAQEMGLMVIKDPLAWWEQLRAFHPTTEPPRRSEAQDPPVNQLSRVYQRLLLT